MSCGVCGSASTGGGEAPKKKTSIANSGIDCQYNYTQVSAWKDLFICIKQRALYTTLQITEAQVNSSLGILYSAINHRNNICYFESYLNTVEVLVIKIINSQLCN